MGRLVDRYGATVVNRACFATAVLAAVVLAGTGLPRWAGLVMLALGLLILDVAVQSGQVANQARIFALAPGLRSRLNSTSMTCEYVAGAAGSWAGAQLFHRVSWYAVSGLIVLLVALPGALSLQRDP